MTCTWCKSPLDLRPRRRDARFCSQRCRQASHRFGRDRRRGRHVAGGHALRIAYADPPYPGLAARYYADRQDYAGEVDHAALLSRLEEHFPDGWALSTSADALPDMLALCPPGVRVAAWFRGERPTPHVRPLNAWEPVIYKGGREYLSDAGEGRRLDALVHVARPRTADPFRLVGSKPAAFCYWLFDLLGMLPGDELVDLFPGSGRVAEAWQRQSLEAIATPAEPSRVDPRDVSRRLDSAVAS